MKLVHLLFILLAVCCSCEQEKKIDTLPGTAIVIVHDQNDPFVYYAKDSFLVTGYTQLRDTIHSENPSLSTSDVLFMYEHPGHTKPIAPYNERYGYIPELGQISMKIEIDDD